MVNDLQRHVYLSSLGIESYAPRWRLPNAPRPLLRTVPIAPSHGFDQAEDCQLVRSIDSSVEPAPLTPISQKAASVPSLLLDSRDVSEKSPEVFADLVEPFSLGIWRPKDGMLIIDSRDSTLALPTHSLLHNILGSFETRGKINLTEAVLRWPMIENRFLSRSAADARNELQTWLAVENELRPIRELWLMGRNAARHFLPEDVPAQHYWQYIDMALLGTQQSLKALLLPSLNEFLQNPLAKAHLFKAINGSVS